VPNRRSIEYLFEDTTVSGRPQPPTDGLGADTPFEHMFEVDEAKD
jgi:hypothetical protein